MNINKKYGKLTVVSFVEKKNYRNWWLCKCTCGNTKICREDRLLNGTVKSCGCEKKKPATNRLNLVGKRFGKLEVISFAYIVNSKSYWNCVCECGKEKVICGKLLIRGTTKSCGCLKQIKGKPRKKRNYKVVSDIKELAKVFGKCEGTIYRAKHLLFNDNISFLSDAQKQKMKNYFETTKGRKLSDCTELAKEFKRCKQTIFESKHILFGENVSKLSPEQRDKMEDYFKHTEQSGNSFEEKEVLDFINSIYSGKVINNDRDTISPKELDIYIPEKKFAIEYDGLYWHSEKKGKKQSYHWNKTKMCMKKGIRLLHIYSSEWRDKQDICKSMIASALGIYERKEYARNCEVKEVTNKKVVIDFFNKNHIQGAVHNYSLCLGLYKDGQLLQAVVFGKQHFGKKGTIELYRMVTKKNTQVIGGFSKLMKHSPYDTVVSYVALRLFDAKGYLAGNWKIEHRSKPSFDITDGANLYTRHLFKKERCLKMFTNVTEDMTEREMQIKNGFYKVWDCGTYKVVWNRP